MGYHFRYILKTTVDNQLLIVIAYKYNILIPIYIIFDKLYKKRRKSFYSLIFIALGITSLYEI